VSGPLVLHVSPHPDDELIGAPATLMALRDAGFRIVSLVLSLGSAEGPRERRRSELDEAAARTGFEVELGLDPEAVARALAAHAPALVVSPAAEDRHPAHQRAAQAVREALERLDQPPPWWTWGLWAPLREPTIFVGFDQRRLDEITAALGAYAGELERNDYRRLVTGRALANAVLGAELVFGFGAAARGAPYAELLAEATFRAGEWSPGFPRELDPAVPFG
jgi:LmbE family N-acetylglucosaminyl deacetylase